MLHRTSNNLVFFVLGGRGGGFKIISKTSESALEIYRNGLVDVEGGGVQEHNSCESKVPLCEPIRSIFLYCVFPDESLLDLSLLPKPHTVESTFSEQAEIIYSFEVGPRGSGDP